MAKKAGWNWLVNSKKWHFFKEDGRSLCGKFLIFGNNEDAETGNNNSPDNCKECARRADKLVTTNAS